jgi:hypothetical protein
MGEYFVCRGKESPEGKAGIRGREEAEKLIIVGYRRGQSLTYVLYTDCASIIVFPLQYRPTLLSTGSLNRFIIKPFEFPLAPTGQSYPFLESIYVIGASSRPPWLTAGWAVSKVYTHSLVESSLTSIAPHTPKYARIDELSSRRHGKLISI